MIQRATLRCPAFRSAGQMLLLAAMLAGTSSCISLGAGGKPPPALLTLTADQAPAAGATRSGNIAEAIVITEPETDQRLAVTRVPVQVDDSTIAYLQNAMWVETPARLLRRLLAETVTAQSSRLVLDTVEPVGGPRMRIGGRLIDFGYDARSSSVVVRFDAVRESGEGRVERRRFEVIEPGIRAEAAPVGAALNRAANKLAREVAAWIG